MTRRLDKALLGAFTFCGSVYQNDECGSNGLPLTPNSIKILGNFHCLCSLRHENLCIYVDLLRVKHERVIVVLEHHKKLLDTEWKGIAEKFRAGRLQQYMYEILDGLQYLHSQGIVHGSLQLENILISPEGSVKLSKFGNYYMSDGGAAVPFSWSCPRFLSPEMIAAGPKSTTAVSSCKVDSWSFGIVVLHLLNGQNLWKNLTLQQLLFKVLSLISSDKSPLQNMLDEHLDIAKNNLFTEDTKALLAKCLALLPSQRSSALELLNGDFFDSLGKKKEVPADDVLLFDAQKLHESLEVSDKGCISLRNVEYKDDLLSERTMKEVYYLWRLAGGDLEAVLRRHGLLRTSPPIHNIPLFITESSTFYGCKVDRSMQLDNTVVVLDQEELRQRLEHLDQTAYFPLLENFDPSERSLNREQFSSSASVMDETSQLPLVIREKDIEYQFHRIILFDRLIRAYPHKRAQLVREARMDIPPLQRAEIWAALLNVTGDVVRDYEAIDKETMTPTDRQIEVDIPRCHQYNDLLSSPVGHLKLKRVLKAWIASHPQYVYWQGLDSLSAPFVYLHFNNEALAFACLNSFIPKYLHQFFLKDNALVIQEYLAVFTQLIAFHEPELCCHLQEIGFIPDLYAIPWFLTMFAHVFPLHKIFHLWDTLLLGNSSFPLCIGVAILQQLQPQLLTFGFNECILLFSDMPEISIDKCVLDSKKVLRATPKSATFRQFEPKPQQQAGKEASFQNLEREPLSAAELKSEMVPRISAQDVLDLSDLGVEVPNQARKAQKPKIVVIDIREREEYLCGTLPNSLNIPASSAFSFGDRLVVNENAAMLQTFSNLVKVVLGGQVEEAAKFAEKLVLVGFSKVCVVHRGVEPFRATGHLVVPPAQL